MLFVHVTDGAAEKSIRRSGLRPSSGWRGKGVYGLPLGQLQREVPRFGWKAYWGERIIENVSEQECFSTLPTPPLSTVDQWRWLARTRRVKRPIAVIARLPSDFGPMSLHLIARAKPSASLKTDVRGLVVSPRTPTSKTVLRDTIRFDEESGLLQLDVEVKTVAELGRLFHVIRRNACTIRDQSDHFELVLKRRIPASWIVSCRPLLLSCRRDGRDLRGNIISQAKMDSDGSEI